MSCRRIEEMIPLYVEGDLEADCADVVSAHLKSCAACSRLAGGFEESQDWLRSYTPPAFDSTFLDGLRTGVLSRIEENKARPWFFQLVSTRWRWDAALAAALFLVILGGLAFFRYQQGFRTAPDRFAGVPSEPGHAPPLHKTPEQIGVESQRIAGSTSQHRHRTLRDAVAEAIVPAQPESMIGLRPDLGIPLSNDSGIEGTALSQADAGQVETQEPVKAASPASESMTRIEIQTSDPAIRIIWFAPNANKNSGRRSTDT